jgi:4-oxalocrotonate tautomerase
MPLVRISIPDHLSAERQHALGQAIHAAMVATINVPELDRFQVFSRHKPEDLIMDPTFPAVQRSRDAAIVHITLRGGRTNDQKRALYEAITSNAAAQAGFASADIMIALAENTLIDWSFGGGVAHYLPTG